MGILDLILASAAGASSALPSANDIVGFYRVGQTLDRFDLAITTVICITICISLLILTNCIKSITGERAKDTKNKEQHCTSGQSSDTADVIKPQLRYEAAWRFFCMCWKVQHPEPIKDKDGKPLPLGDIPALTPEDQKRYGEAWNVISEYIGAKSSDQVRENIRENK